MPNSKLLPGIFHRNTIVSACSTGVIALFMLILILPIDAKADMAIAQMAFNKHHYDLALKELRPHLNDNPEAQYLMAEMYANGLGIAQNIHRAIRWYAKSAASGYSSANFALGKLFEKGADNFPKGYREARVWYQKGAEANHPDSQMRLGLMLQQGRGGAADKVSGMAWLQLAKENDSAHAASLVEINKKKMSPELISQVKLRKLQLFTTIKPGHTGNSGQKNKANTTP